MLHRFGVALPVNLHHTSVNRWQLRFAAACMASRKAWHHDAQERIYRHVVSNHIGLDFRFALHLH